MDLRRRFSQHDTCLFMSELKQILDLWKHARGAGEDICLATVVGVEGSAYRRPGARMLLSSGGRRAGTVSGGCLEAEIAKKALWLTEQGPSVQRYSSFFDDDGDLPYGLGCGGTVVVLLERGEAVQGTLEALRRSVEERSPSAIVTRTDTNTAGTALILDAAGEAAFAHEAGEETMRFAREALKDRQSRSAGNCFVQYVAPPPSLLIFGAGDDARPLVEFAAAMGWHVTVADGRSQLARAERFPGAARVGALEMALKSAGANDAAVVMTHSYEQDRTILRALLGRELKYIGVLGPRRRTERLVQDLIGEMGLTVETAMARLHTPVGLDLGGHSPAPIALSIAAELQAVFAGRTARPFPASERVHA
jgi:xanthine/CO dehydrogenase XdhC/CoxF family maturation factor